MTEASFPVVYFDGNSAIDVCCIFIKPSLDYQTFQRAVSQKIGISHNQITIYYERGPLPLPRSSPKAKIGGNRQTPVTTMFSFASILRDRNCFFLAVLKRPRRDRCRKNKRNALNYPVHGGGGGDLAFGNLNFDFGPTNSPFEAVNYYRSQEVKRLVERERKRFLMSLNMNSNVYSDLDLVSRMSFRGGGFPGGESSTCMAAPVCEVCTRAKIEAQTAPFHLCNCDPILPTPFRSPFGPITRPARTVFGPFS